MKSGKANVRSQFREQLGSRDRRIMADVVRYRLTTNEIVRWCYVPTGSANAATKITGRLVRQGWLNAYPLVDKRLYFVPGKSLVRTLGLPAGRTRPLGVQSLATHLSLANFCKSGTTPYQLLDDAGIAERFPWIPQPLRSTAHVVSVGHDRSLRLIRVDFGGTADYVAKKCRAELSRRESVPGFAKLLSAKQLVLVVLTATECKCDLIKQAIQKLSWPPTIRLQVVVDGDLSQLTGVL